MTAFVVIAIAAVAAGVGVITARNVVHSVLWLIAHLCSLAVLYLMLQATFLGLVQILLYAGAVMVLFLFVLGLLSARAGDDRIPRDPSRALLTVAVEAGVVVAVLLLIAAAGGALYGAARLPASGWGGADAFGAALFSPHLPYLLPFEATALALLVAIVGVVALTHGHDQVQAAGSEAEGAAPGEETVDVEHAELLAAAPGARGEVAR